MSFDGKVAVVTGGAHGIGRAVADAFIKEKAKVHIIDCTPGASIISISSSRDRMSQPQTESYTATKGGISALTHAMAISLSGIARVNSISPGWIDTTGSEITGADAKQQPVERVGKPSDIAETVMFLCSDKAGFITGENICIDGGMTKLMIYHGEYGWKKEFNSL